MPRRGDDATGWSERLSRYSTPMPALADVLSATLLRLWPARRHQELLLDLGERKGWTEVDRADALLRLAGWLSRELVLPESIAGSSELGGDSWPVLPDLPVSHLEAVPGVGLRTVALAKLAGADPKTLANTLGRPPRSDRRAHRWLLFLRRLEREEVLPNALVFHRRSADLIGTELGRAFGATPDAGDALLVMSLIALWQRRRPTEEAKAARGSGVSRRLVPKPAVAMKWDVVELRQIRPLIDFALHRGGGFGRTLVAVALEAALTEAHLAPHRPRGVGAADPAWGDLWLRTIDEILDVAPVAALLGDREVAVFRWRVARMRSYAARTLGPPPDLAASEHPYVELAAAVDSVRCGETCARRFPAQEPGYFMLLPQARRLGLVEDG